MNLELKLEISGMGIIIYSDYAVSHIAEGQDYFSTNYYTGEQVLKHIYDGSIVGFCTSSPGTFILKIRSGYPSETELECSDYRMRLGICVKGNNVRFNDLFALMDWNADNTDIATVELEDGYYHITLVGSAPKSGVLGDNQEIYVYFNKLDTMPKLKYNGVPIFCD
ncbi:hypothetical protein [Acetivibrio cellulolyticus]|uniref:hypothetical protein n=1 Tax=Acetivibrio cellulolyticus TaxID=35830 RepID=UPI0001E2D546|nr:hypothetical protein [Acetivibrio cellulolyticus]